MPDADTPQVEPLRLTPEEYRDVERALRMLAANVGPLGLLEPERRTAESDRLKLLASRFAVAAIDARNVVLRDPAAVLVEALESIIAGAPTEFPELADDDDPYHPFVNTQLGRREEHFRLAEIARAALARVKGGERL